MKQNKTAKALGKESNPKQETIKTKYELTIVLSRDIC